MQTNELGPVPMKYLHVEGVDRLIEQAQRSLFRDGGMERNKVKTAKGPLSQGGKFVGGWWWAMGNR